MYSFSFPWPSSALLRLSFSVHIFCDTVPLKGTESRDFRPLFFCSKDSTWNPYEQAKTVLQSFRFRVQFQNSHVPIVNDYADTEF